MAPSSAKSRQQGKLPAEFLYDWAFAQDGRVQWVAELYTLDRHLAALSNEVYLMVDAARATAEDRCPKAFARAYGPNGRRLYEEARANASNADEPFNLWNEHGLARSLPERLAARGLAREDFRPDPSLSDDFL